MVNRPDDDPSGTAGGKIFFGLVYPKAVAEILNGHAALDLVTQGVEDKYKHCGNAILVPGVDPDEVAFFAVVFFQADVFDFGFQHVVGDRLVTGGTAAFGLFLVKLLFFGVFDGLLGIAHGFAESLAVGFLGFAPPYVGEIGARLHDRLAVNPSEDDIPEQSPIAMGD